MTCLLSVIVRAGDFLANVVQSSNFSSSVSGCLKLVWYDLVQTCIFLRSPCNGVAILKLCILQSLAGSILKQNASVNCLRHSHPKRCVGPTVSRDWRYALRCQTNLINLIGGSIIKMKQWKETYHTRSNFDFRSVLTTDSLDKIMNQPKTREQIRVQRLETMFLIQINSDSLVETWGSQKQGNSSGLESHAFSFPSHRLKQYRGQIPLPKAWKNHLQRI